jgi:hypothetical protein
MSWGNANFGGISNSNILNNLSCESINVANLNATDIQMYDITVTGGTLTNVDLDSVNSNINFWQDISTMPLTTGHFLQTTGPAGSQLHWASGTGGAVTTITGTPNEIDLSSNTGDVVVSISPNCEIPGTLLCTNQVTINGSNGALTVLPSDIPSVAGQVLVTNDTDGSVSWSNSPSVRIGAGAGIVTGGNNVVAIGFQAGASNQNPFSVSIGNQAGHDTQGIYSIAIGTSCANSNQGSNSIAIGNTAAYVSQGNSAIAIGAYAGQTSQHDNSIVINATGSTRNSTGVNTCVIQPIAGTSTATRTLMYDETSGELQYLDSSTAKTFVIEHPIEPDSKYLIHACLEGPEMGIYYRGTSKIQKGENSVKVNLPYYLSKLAYDFTIQCTQFVDDDIEISFVPSYIVVSKVKNEDNVYFNVYGLENTVFHWTVLAKRVGELEVELEKKDVVLHGKDTPYTYITKEK